MELSLPLAHRLRAGGTSKPAPRGKARRGKDSGGALGSVLASLRHNRRLVRGALCLLLAVALLGGGWLWLRDSSLVAVRHVHITGVRGPDAVEIRQALDSAAKGMTTMDLHVGALRAAVSSLAIVSSLHVKASFPHTLSISVSERPPVAALLSAGQRTAVAADGVVLGPALLSGSLPSVSSSVEPRPGARLSEAGALAAVAVLGAAPAPLVRFVSRVFNGPEGLTVAMRTGLLVYFGNATRPHAKWLSLARVLTSPSSAGALYVDVRLPERPAAGFSLPSSSSSSSAAPASSGTGAATPEAATDPNAAALAESLAQAAGGSSGASPGPPASGGSSESEASSSTASGAEASEASTPAAGSTQSESSGSSEASG
jgi:cell division protein FtsQ